MQVIPVSVSYSQKGVYLTDWVAMKQQRLSASSVYVWEVAIRPFLPEREKCDCGFTSF